MKYETSATTAAEPSRLWSVVTDVARWRDWIDVYQDVRRAEPGPLQVGSSTHVRQRGLAAGDWTVTELDEGRMFAWESKQPGVRILGRHLVTPEPGGGSRLTLQLEIDGFLSGLVSAMYGKRSRAYVDLECRRLTEVAGAPPTA